MSVYEIDDPAAIPFESSLAFDSSSYIEPEYLHVIYGLSKDLAASGMRVGCLFSRNKQVLDAMSGIGAFHFVSRLADEMAANMLENDAWLESFSSTSRNSLAQRNKLTRSLLEESGITYEKGANAGFFLWLDLSPWLKITGKDDEWEAEKDLNERFLKAKVFLTPGSAMAAEKPGWFRIIFSQNEPVIREGLRRVFAVLKQQ